MFVSEGNLMYHSRTYISISLDNYILQECKSGVVAPLHEEEGSVVILACKTFTMEVTTKTDPVFCEGEMRLYNITVTHNSLFFKDERQKGPCIVDAFTA